MKLHDQLCDAVADVSADLPALAAASRRRGLAIRRRRRALASVGAAAAVVAVTGAAGVGLAVRPGPGAPASVDRGFASPTPSAAGATSPNTGRTTAAALAAAVADVADGTFAAFRGQDPSNIGAADPAGDESYAEFLFTPASGGAAGLVEVNLQDLSILEECTGNDKDGTKACTEPTAYECGQSFMLHCTATVLANGDTLRTYTDRASSSGRGRVRRVAELLSPARHLRVVAGATNTDARERVTRPDPVLSTAQLRRVVSQEWWNLRLPQDYADAGQRLPSYADLGGSIDATGSAPPSAKG